MQQIDTAKQAQPLHFNKPVKPFIKWAGGKSQLLNEIRRAYPNGLGNTVTKYAEPFVGGGAVLFDVLNSYQFEAVYISDINRELINTYTAIKDNVTGLTTLLNKMQEQYSPADMEQRKLYFYDKRTRFNELIAQESITSDSVECAALFIFLNKTCFNGLYRVNSRGLYNVPMGVYKNPFICDADNLESISQKLKNVTILCDDYKKSESFIDEHTFAYFDPPYRPLTETASFTSYTSGGFDDAAQTELAEFIHKITKLNAKVVVSNSDPKNVNKDDNFFDELYGQHQISRVKAVRMINSNGNARGEINELLICSR